MIICGKYDFLGNKSFYFPHHHAIHIYWTKEQRNFGLRLSTSGRMTWNRKDISLEHWSPPLGLLNTSRYVADIWTYSQHWVSSRCQLNRDDPGISRVIIQLSNILRMTTPIKSMTIFFSCIYIQQKVLKPVARKP